MIYTSQTYLSTIEKLEVYVKECHNSVINNDRDKPKSDDGLRLSKP